MKKILFLSNLAIVSLFFLGEISHANTLIERNISGYKAKIIEYRTDSEIYGIKIGVHPTDGGTLRSIANDVGAITGVNGVFECPKDYSACGGKNYTINERYVEGEKRGTYKSTGDRVVFGWNKHIEPFLFQTDTINKDKESEIWEGFANHPLLLKNGETQTHLYHEKGLIDYKMKSKATKNFICSNKPGDTIYFGLVYSIDIDSLANALRDFGCYNAINLDAGASTSFLYNGKYITGPQRDILDGVFIVPKDIDTQVIKNKAKIIVNTLLGDIQSKDSSLKIKALTQMQSTLHSLSTNIYDQNTYDLFEEKKSYKEILIFEGIKTNIEDVKLLLSKTNSKDYFIADDNLYKNTLQKTEQIKVGTKTEITSTVTLRQLLLINYLREYFGELTEAYKQIQKIENLRKMEGSLEIEVRVK